MTAKLFLELFAGSCRMARSFAMHGIPAESFEVTRDARENVFSPENTGSIFARMKKGRICLVWSGIACASWSRARRGRGYGCGFPPPLRGDTPDTIWGLPGLNSKDRWRVKLGNQSARWMVRVIRHAIKTKTPLIMENPATSRLWLCPPIRRLLASASVVTLDACQYGAPWRKSTRLAAWNVDVSSLERRCVASHGICSRSKKPHQPLVGVAPDGQFWTAKASPYAFELCEAVSRLAHPS